MKESKSHSNKIMRFGIGLVLTTVRTSHAVAHDSWINRGRHRNAACEGCRGDNDCQSIDQIAVTGRGWVVGGTEFVPFEEASPPGRQSLDLPQALSHAPVRIRAAARFVT